MQHLQTQNVSCWIITELEMAYISTYHMMHIPFQRRSMQFVSAIYSINIFINGNRRSEKQGHLFVISFPTKLCGSLVTNWDFLKGSLTIASFVFINKPEHMKHFLGGKMCYRIGWESIVMTMHYHCMLNEINIIPVCTSTDHTINL